MRKILLVTLFAALLFGTSTSATAKRKTWADYGYPPGVITKDDFRPAQEVHEPKYNLMAPNFWAQFKEKR